MVVIAKIHNDEIKRKNIFLFFSPTQFDIHGQWWSYVGQHLLQTLQCFLLKKMVNNTFILILWSILQCEHFLVSNGTTTQFEFWVSNSFVNGILIFSKLLFSKFPAGESLISLLFCTWISGFSAFD